MGWEKRGRATSETVLFSLEGVGLGGVWPMREGTRGVDLGLGVWVWERGGGEEGR